MIWQLSSRKIPTWEFLFEWRQHGAGIPRGVQIHTISYYAVTSKKKWYQRIGMDVYWLTEDIKGNRAGARIIREPKKHKKDFCGRSKDTVTIFTTVATIGKRKRKGTEEYVNDS